MAKDLGVLDYWSFAVVLKGFEKVGNGSPTYTCQGEQTWTT